MIRVMCDVTSFYLDVDDFSYLNLQLMLFCDITHISHHCVACKA